MENFIGKCYNALNPAVTYSRSRNDELPTLTKEVHLPTVVEVNESYINGKNKADEKGDVPNLGKGNMEKKNLKGSSEGCSTVSSDGTRKSFGNLRSLKLVRALAGLIKW